jgi:hypothetical protein
MGKKVQSIVAVMNLLSLRARVYAGPPPTCTWLAVLLTSSVLFVHCVFFPSHPTHDNAARRQLPRVVERSRDHTAASPAPGRLLKVQRKALARDRGPTVQAHVYY